MRKHFFTVVCAVLLGAGALLDAQGGRITRYQPPPTGLRFAESLRPNQRGGSTSIIGSVIDIRQVPVAHAKVQLRNLITGTVEQEEMSNTDGEYAFQVDEAGTYVVEMVMVDGYVVALSNAGALSRFETMQTVIMLPGRWNPSSMQLIAPPNMSNFVGMSAVNTITSTTIEMAVNQNIGVADSGEPVSP